MGAYGGVKDQSPWVRVRPEAKCFRWMVLEFNPVVTFASLLLILGFVTWAMVSPEQAGQEFTHWKSWVGLNFTWLYIGAQVATLLSSNFFVLWIISSVPRTDGRCLWRTSTSASMAASGSGGRTRGPNTMTSPGQL